MAQVTRTINQLPFESLDPHRFEDLVRQLSYDFKPWKNLEDTGSSGNDQGYDARGWESVILDEDLEDDENNEESKNTRVENRVWLIQSKREKEIGPKKMEEYLGDIFSKNKGKLYGIIFTAACDFSKGTRDVFIEKIRKEGVQEFQLWGKGELEDLLFQPKNDHLLFAYFGISIMIRKRSLTSKIKSKLAIKRKVIRIFGGVARDTFRPVLIRNAEDETYPYGKNEGNTYEKKLWFPAHFVRHYTDGIIVVFRRHMAALDKDSKHWDFIRSVNEVSLPRDYQRRTTKEQQKIESEAKQAWSKMPDDQKAYLEVIGFIPYDRIIEIDEDGDPSIQDPHIFVTYQGVFGPFYGQRGELKKESYHASETLLNPANPKDIIKIFPEKFTASKKKNK